MAYTDEEKNKMFNLLIFIRSTRDLPDIYSDKIFQYLFNCGLIIPHMYDWTSDGHLFGGYYLTKLGRSFLKNIDCSERAKRSKEGLISAVITDKRSIVFEDKAGDIQTIIPAGKLYDIYIFDQTWKWIGSIDIDLAKHMIETSEFAYLKRHKMAERNK